MKPVLLERVTRASLLRKAAMNDEQMAGLLEVCRTAERINLEGASAKIAIDSNAWIKARRTARRPKKRHAEQIHLDVLAI